MTVKVLRNRNSIPVLIVPEGISVKNASSFEDEMFFVLAEAPFDKSEDEISLEKEAKFFYERLYHNSTNPFVRRQRDFKAIEEIRLRYEHALLGLNLERDKRLQDVSRLYLGGFGDLKGADIYDHSVQDDGIRRVRYGIERIRGQFFASCSPENKYEGHRLENRRVFFLKSQPESQHKTFAIHNKRKLNLVRRV